MTNAIDLDVELPRTTAAPRAARRALCGAADGRYDAAVLADAELLVSELVTNAVLHGVGAIRLRLRLCAQTLLVEVLDDGAGFDWVLTPDSCAAGGRGLGIIDRVATRWGVRAGSSHVWFELSTDRLVDADHRPADAA